jgi:hypothetical protein
MTPPPLLQLDLLDLSGTGLTSVPAWMSALVALTDLQLASNEMQVGHAPLLCMAGSCVFLHLGLGCSGQHRM